MPLMFSSWGLICLSAISVTSRKGRGEESAICMIGVASGSNFCTTGALAVSGRSLTIRFTLSRISCAPTSPFLSRSKVMTTVEAPSTEVELMLSMPLMVLTASSTRLVMSVSTSSADAPGLLTETDTVGKSIFGKKIHAQGEERKPTHHHERHNQHSGENRPFDAEFR